MYPPECPSLSHGCFLHVAAYRYAYRPHPEWHLTPQQITAAAYLDLSKFQIDSTSAAKWEAGNRNPQTLSRSASGYPDWLWTTTGTAARSSLYCWQSSLAPLHASHLTLPALALSINVSAPKAQTGDLCLMKLLTVPEAADKHKVLCSNHRIDTTQVSRKNKYQTPEWRLARAPTKWTFILYTHTYRPTHVFTQLLQTNGQGPEVHQWLCWYCVTSVFTMNLLFEKDKHIILHLSNTQFFPKSVNQNFSVRRKSWIQWIKLL